MMTQWRTPIPLETPKGDGFAHLVIGPAAPALEHANGMHRATAHAAQAYAGRIGSETRPRDGGGAGRSGSSS